MNDETQSDQVVTMSIPDEALNPQQNAAAPATLSPINPQTDDIVKALENPIPEEVKPKHAGGRPCEYCENKEEIDRVTEEYFQKCYAAAKPQIPYIEELALLLRKDTDTINNWVVKQIKPDAPDQESVPEHPEFIGAIKKIKDLQRLYLLRRTTGRYNPTGAIFQLKANHGFMESEKRILAGDSKEPIQVEIIEEVKRITDD